MIIEGLCTTTNPDGSTNIAPMGPIVNDELTSFLFRPFQSSATFHNLQTTRCGVFHVTDDVGIIARAAIGTLTETPRLIPAQSVDGQILASACRWYEFDVISIDDSQPRSEIRTELKHTGTLREFWGYNRARHAILEASILATRLQLLKAEEVRKQMERLQVIVDKTANDADKETFQHIVSFIGNH